MGNEFDWSPQPRAAAWVAARSSELRGGLPFAEEIKQRLLAEAGVRFDDMIDAICLGNNDPRIADAVSNGWVQGRRAASIYSSTAPAFFPPSP
jgi:hypothetical protein